ncbi:MAG: hypothetical protein J6K45_04710 [Clostridia bacterium]|nr:hypothetical protein [Clostridia bacterium]
MSNYPQYAEIENTQYPINTDFRVALKCNEVAESDVSEEEKSLAIIYLLYGDKGIEASHHWEKLLKIAMKYLTCGKENTEVSEKEVDMSYKEDMGYIKTSFFYDYQIDLNAKKMHWWEFYEKLCGLSEKCILNRVIYLRTFDISQIKDRKEKEKWIKQKKAVALKQKKIIKKTKKEEELDRLFREQINPRRR